MFLKTDEKPLAVGGGAAISFNDDMDAVDCLHIRLSDLVCPKTISSVSHSFSFNDHLSG